MVQEARAAGSEFSSFTERPRNILPRSTWDVGPQPCGHLTAATEGLQELAKIPTWFPRNPRHGGGCWAERREHKPISIPSLRPLTASPFQLLPLQLIPARLLGLGYTILPHLLCLSVFPSIHQECLFYTYSNTTIVTFRLTNSSGFMVFPLRVFQTIWWCKSDMYLLETVLQGLNLDLFTGYWYIVWCSFEIRGSHSKP
jgi:hypothetical protein